MGAANLVLLLTLLGSWYCDGVASAGVNKAAASYSSYFLPVAAQYDGPPLSFGFYSQSCPQLDRIVSRAVSLYTRQFPTTPAKLLRLFFHDAFVQGADASVLLLAHDNYTDTERDAPNNFSLGSFFVIDDIKRQLEEVCPNTVSCADILAVAAVYAIAEAGGPLYPIELGRRDALVAYARSAQTFLPGATLSVDGLLQNFQTVGLGLLDVVALSGGHTIGQTHCSSIKERLYPTVDPEFKMGEQLLSFCSNQGKLKPPNFQQNTEFFMDTVTPLTFDNQYFVNLQNGQAILASDKALVQDNRTAGLVNLYATDKYAFLEQFGESLRRMGKLNVLTGTKGQIRKQCWTRNS